MAVNLSPWLSDQLSVLLARAGHAWLLQGPSGLGQYTLALELAKARLCHEPSEHGACGVCPSCHLVDVKSHPDLFVLMPEVQMLDLEWPLSEKAQKEIDDKDRKPSKEIRVEAVRDMVEFSQRTSSSEKPKMVLTYPAEKLNIYAANMILKTLEEPPGDTRFILASEAAHLLLPTIRSRCQTHTMIWPGEQPSVLWLNSQGVPSEQAEILFRACGGRPEDALELTSIGIDANLWSKIPVAIAKGDGSILEGFSPKQVIEILQKLCHDLVAKLFNTQPRYFYPESLPKAQNLGALTAWYKELSQEALTSEHPFNASLMVENLCIQASKAIRS